MTVYVDQYPGSGWGKWQGGGHMTTSDLDELHAFAAKIGLKRSWFQDGTIPHYDLTANKRRLALANGAIGVDAFEEFPPDTLMRCQDGTYETHEERMRRHKEKRNGEVVQDVQQTEA